MTREIAKQLVNVIEQGLCEKQQGIAKHWELIKAFADGAEIQVETYNGWTDTGDPDFQEACHYRMKPELPKRWLAEKGGVFLTIYDCYGLPSTSKSINMRIVIDDKVYNSANYFQTKGKAQVVADKIAVLFVIALVALFWGIALCEYLSAVCD